MNGDEVFTGFDGLDEVLGGYRPGTLNVIAGRPGMGKTALALSIARNAAKDYCRTVLYFSLESSRTDIFSRLTVFNETSRPGCESLSSMAERIGKLPVYIDDYWNVTPEYIAKRVRELSDETENGIELIVIDYYQLMDLPDKSRSDRWDKLSCVSHRLKELAVELYNPILLLTQVHKNSDYRDDHIPKLTDLRLSSALDSDADSVVFIVRPGYYNMKNDDSKAQLIVAKNNYGEADVKIDVLWDRAKRRFTEPFNKDHDDREKMTIFKTVLADQGRYKYFTFLEHPVSFKTVFGGRDYARVDVYSTMVLNGEDTVAFCGRFEWNNGNITSLDGDSYNKEMTVYGFSKFYDRVFEQETLEILVGDDW